LNGLQADGGRTSSESFNVLDRSIRLPRPRAPAASLLHRFTSTRRLGAGPLADIGNSLSGVNSGGIASKIVRSGGMIAQAGRLRAKIAIVGWKED
jgi:hypothetical protein